MPLADALVLHGLASPVNGGNGACAIATQVHLGAWVVDCYREGQSLLHSGVSGGPYLCAGETPAAHIAQRCTRALFIFALI